MMYFIGTMLAELFDPIVFLICCALSYSTRKQGYFLRLIIILSVTVPMSQLSKVVVGYSWETNFFETLTAKLIVALVCLLIFRPKPEQE
jgi:hypothetical protein